SAAAEVPDESAAAGDRAPAAGGAAPGRAHQGGGASGRSGGAPAARPAGPRQLGDERLRPVGADDAVSGGPRRRLLAVRRRPAGQAATDLDSSQPERDAAPRAGLAEPRGLLPLPHRDARAAVPAGPNPPLPLPRPARPVHRRPVAAAGLLRAGGAHQR